MEHWMWFKTLPLLLKYTVWVVSVLEIVCHGSSNCFVSYLSDTEMKNINPVIMQSRFWHNQPQFCLILQLQFCILNGGKTGRSCSSVWVGVFYVQVMFRYLCEEGRHVFSEKQSLSAVRKLATKLILSGKTESGRNDLWPLKSSPALTLHQPSPSSYPCVPGELRTYEALSSDMQKNVLSALRRLETVTKLRAWVTRLAPANLFGF